MTELRDVRLRQALDEAPDAQLQPQARTREAIRAAAHGAVQPAWRRWWSASGRRRTPWAAAFATIALATLVTVMWEGQEVPDARREAPAADQVAQAPVPLPVPAPVPPAAMEAPVVAAAPPVPPPAAAPPPPPPPPPARARPQLRERAPSSRAAATAPPPAPAAAPPVLADAAPAAAPARPEVLAREGSARQEARALPSAPAAAPMPAPAPAAAPSVGAAAPPAAALRAAPAAAVRWTQVRIEADGKSVVVTLDQAGRLPSLITRMLAAEREPAATTPGALRLELAEGNELAGVLELVGERWRWTPLRDTQQARMLKADPALASALRDEAQSLLK